MDLEACSLAFASSEEFLPFADMVCASPASFVKFVSSLPLEHRGEFWLGLCQAVRTSSRTFSALALATLAISSFLSSDLGKHPVPQSLLDLVGLLHEHLFELQEEPELQEEVVQICERWYLEKRPNREAFLPQLLPTLLLRSFEEDKSPNRVFALRETLVLFDFGDDSAQGLKHLLLKCLTSPIYLKPPKGIKVLAVVMSLSLEMMFACHAEMRRFQEASTKFVEPFCQVYYETWALLHKKVDGGDADAQLIKEAFESEILQNELVRNCIYLASGPKRRLGLKLLHGAFHENKKDKRVDPLLCRVYPPFIFSGLDAVNAEVRRNAATLFFLAFPLYDPLAHEEELARLLEQQFKSIEGLLKDPNPECRACAAEGVCRILSLFWETIPKSKSSKLFQLVVSDLAFDKSSSQVRRAVCQGLVFMLDFPLCHGVLMPSLRGLKSLLHDRSLAVRKAFCALLVKLHGMEEDAARIPCACGRGLGKTGAGCCPQIDTAWVVHPFAAVVFPLGCELSGATSKGSGLDPVQPHSKSNLLRQPQVRDQGVESRGQVDAAVGVLHPGETERARAGGGGRWRCAGGPGFSCVLVDPLGLGLGKGSQFGRCKGEDASNVWV